MTTDERQPTVASATNEACRKLREAGIESPRLTAQLLVAHTLGWERVRVLSHGEEPLAPASVQKIAELVRRRSQAVPLQHLTGRQEFFGLEFEVGPDVLVPRPETEILVEKALELSHSVDPGPLVFADVGTGSGCIAVAMAHALERARGWAVDISAAALRVARGNAGRHGVGARVNFVRSDLLDGFRDAPVFDLVLSNPPYVPLRDAGTLAAEVRDHEPHVALFGGDTGLDIYRRLIPQAFSRLKPEGTLVLEIGIGMTPDVCGLLENSGFMVTEVATDLQSIPRCIVSQIKKGVRS
jgi:release factor glutamine methyltransferase